MIEQSVIFGCGSMGGFVYVLRCAVILLVIGAVLWPINLCLALGLNNASQKVHHSVFTLLCAAAGVIVYAISQSESHPFGILVLGFHLVPLTVIGHFIYLVVLRRRQRDQLLKRANAVVAATPHHSPV